MRNRELDKFNFVQVMFEASKAQSKDAQSSSEICARSEVKCHEDPDLGIISK